MEGRSEEREKLLKDKIEEANNRCRELETSMERVTIKEKEMKDILDSSLRSLQLSESALASQKEASISFLINNNNY